MLKTSYVKIMSVSGAGLASIGALTWLEERRDARWAHWSRSLFAIHDIDQLIGLDVPWWTYRAIDVAEEFLESRTGLRAFEYGSGASTVWLSRRVDTLTSIEHDPDWFPIVQARVRDNTKISLRLIERDRTPSSDEMYHSRKPGQIGHSFQAYAAAIIEEDGVFDVIVIDGRARSACLRNAVRKLAPGGMIVFDNSRRRRYARAIAESGLQVEVHSGLVPSLPYPSQTALLRRH